MKSLRSWIALLLVFVWGCSPLINYDSTIVIDGEEVVVDVFPKQPQSNENDTTSFSLDRDHPAVVAMRKRAYQLASVKWTPLFDLIGNRPAGRVVKGIPYSSVKELDKFVGQEVSFYTFMTAVNNPRSVVYTEDVGAPPYKGVNCHLYYGTVCSMAVNYALGIERPYRVSMIRELSLFQPVAQQDFLHCAPGDIIWTKGHVVLITDVEKNDKGEVSSIEILESGGHPTGIYYYSIDEANNRWKDSEWKLYRYKDLQFKTEYSPIGFVPVFEEIPQAIKYNNELCISRGDCSTYRVGEDVVINLLSNEYSLIVLKRGSDIFEVRSVSGETDIVFSNLPSGIYSAYLESPLTHSAEVSFEIIDTSIKVSKDSGLLEIILPNNDAFPEYVVICSETGSRQFISDIQEADRRIGRKYIRCEHSVSGLYLKVFFKGRYGRVSNEMIPLN